VARDVGEASKCKQPLADVHQLSKAGYGGGMRMLCAAHEFARYIILQYQSNGPGREIIMFAGSNPDE